MQELVNTGAAHGRTKLWRRRAIGFERDVYRVPCTWIRGTGLRSFAPRDTVPTDDSNVGGRRIVAERGAILTPTISLATFRLAVRTPGLMGRAAKNTI